MILLEIFQADELLEVTKSDGFTVVGILMAVNVVCISVSIFLYKSKDKLHKEYIQELKAQNEITLKMIKDYNDFSNSLRDAFKK